MSEQLEPGLLRAILEDPWDDTPRLIMADWLEERGDPRGEFIRTQFNGYHLQPHYPDSKYSYTQHRMIDKRLGWVAGVNRLLLDAGQGNPGQKNIGSYSWNEEDDGSIWMQIGDARFTLRRGFVESISLPTAAFCGVGCERCSGGRWSGRNLNIPGHSICPVCNGTGRTTGHAEAIFSSCPVVSVLLPDRKPRPTPSEDYNHPNMHCWWDHDEFGGVDWEADDLPHCLFELLECGTKRYQDYQQRHYPDDKVALDDLNHACVKYGRQEAKLGAIQWRERQSQPPT